MKYPDTRVDETVECLAGVSFADPYRWLEQNSEEVRRWQRTQAELASAHVREWPDFERLRQLVERYNLIARVPLPRYAGGRWFRMHLPAGASQSQAIVSDSPDGEGRVLFDPVRDNPQQPPFLSWLSPSPDGRTLAIGVCTDGSENNTIRLIDASTGEFLADPPPQILMDNWTGGAQWLPDSSGFFFSAITGPATDFTQQVYLHRRWPTNSTTQLDVPWTQPKEWRTVSVSRDGRYVAAVERLRNPIPIAVASLRGEAFEWRPFVTDLAATVAGSVVEGHYIAVTDHEAPRGRLVSIPLDAANPNDPSTWTELVPQSHAVMRTATLVGDVIYLSEFIDTYARVRIVDVKGRMRGEVPLPGRGAIGEQPFPIMNLSPASHPQQFVFAFSSLTTSTAIYSHRPGTDMLETLQPPKEQLPSAIVEDRKARSRDGTWIPYHLVRRSDALTDAPQPTLLFAYGGFNVPLVPQFPGAMAAFVAAGGVFVQAHLRGGGEFGAEWWRAGCGRNKQNGYHDLFAVAEDLIGAGICTPHTLALVGMSNGGLLAGVAATQRPDLWRVVVPRVPILDLIGACREPYGRMIVQMEFADVEDPAEVERLATFSPYQLVEEGTRYPAVFIDAGDTDPRCPPWHARKFAARLQKATSSSAPVLLHVWENVGHGWATDKTIATREHTEWLAFTLRHLGVKTLLPAEQRS